MHALSLYLSFQSIRALNISGFAILLSDAEVIWCQEEPMNMGGYSYIAPRLATAMRSVNRGTYEDIKYVGRPPSAATATGFQTLHIKEQKELVQKALQVSSVP